MGGGAVAGGGGTGGGAGVGAGEGLEFGPGVGEGSGGKGWLMARSLLEGEPKTAGFPQPSKEQSNRKITNTLNTAHIPTRRNFSALMLAGASSYVCDR